MKMLLMGAAALSLLAGSAGGQERHWDRGHDRDHDRGRWSDRHDRSQHGRFYYRGRAYGRVSGPEWAGPRGWQYRRYAVGAYVPRPLLAPQFVIDPGAFGLAFRPAPRGARWVRAGDDLLLVSWRTGRVIEVIPDVFY